MLVNVMPICVIFGNEKGSMAVTIYLRVYRGVCTDICCILTSQFFCEHLLRSVIISNQVYMNVQIAAILCVREV